MVQPFSYWHSVRDRRIEAMQKILLLSLLMSGVIYGQNQAPEKIKPDVTVVQNAVNDAVGSTLPGWGVLQGAKGAYLDGYGVVVTIEVALDSPLTPFSGQKTPEEVRATAKQRRKEVEEKLTNILKEKTASLQSIAPAESVAIIVNILNTNPAYIPEMPAQIIFSVKKQDAAHVNVREYK
jgi:hypothetical protein